MISSTPAVFPVRTVADFARLAKPHPPASATARLGDLLVVSLSNVSMPDSVPTKPIVALTLALAGKRRIEPEASARLRERLELVFDAMAGRLASLCEPGA